VSIHFTFTEADVRRFLKYVEVLPSGYHFWTGARSRGKGNRKWYGSFRISRRVVRAHKFAAVALGRGFTPGNHLDHTCGFSLCVNWKHLDDVTPKENNDRKLARQIKCLIYPRVGLRKAGSSIRNGDPL
jgi:hypothetical protein